MYVFILVPMGYCRKQFFLTLYISLQELDLNKKPSPILHVQPIDEVTQGATTDTVTRLELITQEEGDVWDQSKNEPLPGALGYVGVELGPNGEVPEGFRKDEEGNVIVSFGYQL